MCLLWHLYDFCKRSNNYYKLDQALAFQYSWGVGVESAIYAENNYFETGSAVAPSQFIARYNGAAIHESGTYVNGVSEHDLINVLDAYNATHDPDLSGDAGWTPTLYVQVDPTQSVPGLVPHKAGPFNW